MTDDHDDGTESVTGPGRAGRDEMNGEHHIQLSLLFALREAVGAGQADNAEDILERLIDYSKMHFASEQLLMRLYQYGEYEGHAGEHEQMIQRLEDLRAEQAEGHAGAIAGALDDLDAGLVGHIRGADRRLGLYLGRLPQQPLPAR